MFGSLMIDAAFIINGRGHPERVVLALAQRAPNGATVAIETEGPKAYLMLDAAQRSYPLIIEQKRCGTAKFRMVERKANEASTPGIVRCGQVYVRVADDNAIGPSGVSWALYQRSTAP